MSEPSRDGDEAGTAVDLGPYLDEFERSESVEADEAAQRRLRELACADPVGFERALFALEHPERRSSVFEALIVEGRVPDVLLAMVPRYLRHEVERLSALRGPTRSRYDAPLLPLFSLGDLEWPYVGDELADALYDGVLTCVRHTDPHVRALAVDLLVAWGRPSRRGSREPVLELLRNDPDPLVRHEAYQMLAAAQALPEGTRPVWRPTLFRGLRRWWAGLGR